MPTGLRSPEANTRFVRAAGSISRLAARSTSTAIPLSDALLLDPTPTYSRESSRLADRLLAQSWLNRPRPRRSLPSQGTPTMATSPDRYDDFTRSQACAYAT